MMATRRRLLTTLVTSGIPLAVLSFELMAQVRPSQAPPKPAREDESEAPKFDSKTALEANKKDIKKDVEKLFQLASELKAEVEKTDSVQVLSMAMLKKAEEIEKLAKEIRTRAIG